MRWPEILDPSRAGKLVDPVKIDLEHVVGAIPRSGRELWDELLVHDRVGDFFEIDGDAGLLGELRQHLLDDGRLQQVLHQQIERRPLEVAREGDLLCAGGSEHGCPVPDRS